MNLHSYPKVYAIGHKAVAELFDGPVLVEEKIDGSQFSFGEINGQLCFRSRGAEIHVNEPDKMFAAAVNQAGEIANKLHPGWTYRGEYLQKPKHNTLVYDRVPRRNVILFDINTGLEEYLARNQKEEEAERLDFELVPILYEGVITSPEELLKLLETDSCLGGQKVEGIVVKNYARFGADKKVLMGKYVREDFKEKHSRAWKKANPGTGDVIGHLIAVLRNENRWEKAVQHLREKGQLEGSPRDIGPLIREAQEDIKAEETESIKNSLFNYAMPRILRASTGGLAEWYKKKLLESAFVKEP